VAIGKSPPVCVPLLPAELHEAFDGGSSPPPDPPIELLEGGGIVNLERVLFGPKLGTLMFQIFRPMAAASVAARSRAKPRNARCAKENQKVIEEEPPSPDSEPQVKQRLFFQALRFRFPASR